MTSHTKFGQHSTMKNILKNYDTLYSLKPCKQTFHREYEIIPMPKPIIVGKAEIDALFNGIIRLIADIDPKACKVFSNYQTLYSAFARAKDEIAELKAEIATLRANKN